VPGELGVVDLVPALVVPHEEIGPAGEVPVVENGLVDNGCPGAERLGGLPRGRHRIPLIDLDDDLFFAPQPGKRRHLMRPPVFDGELISPAAGPWRTGQARVPSLVEQTAMLAFEQVGEVRRGVHRRAVSHGRAPAPVTTRTLVLDRLVPGGCQPLASGRIWTLIDAVGEFSGTGTRGPGERPQMSTKDLNRRILSTNVAYGWIGELVKDSFTKSGLVKESFTSFPWPNSVHKGLQRLHFVQHVRSAGGSGAKDPSPTSDWPTVPLNSPTAS
jgi:hypothetical protein